MEARAECSPIVARRDQRSLLLFRNHSGGRADQLPNGISVPYPTTTAMIQYNVNGNLYGTTATRIGSTVAGDEIFAMTPSGTMSTVYNFDDSGNPRRIRPLAPLVEGTDGFFYGTTDKWRR